MIADEDRACMTPVTTVHGTWEFGETIHVQFNPETLEITSTSKIEEDKGERQNKTPVQVVAGTERRLSVQLIFDETLTGTDVRNRTTQIVGMMRAGENTLEDYGRNGADKDVMLPSVVLFEWGNMTFQGTISECTETLEYFSAGGIPLRASVKFAMTEQDAVFEPETGADSAPPDDSGMDLPADQPLPPGSDVQDAAQKNGVEDMRNPGTDKLYSGSGSAGGSVRGALGANAQASASVGGAGASASASASAGFGAAAGAGIGAGAGVEFGLPAAAVASGKIGFGASASAGIGLGVDFGGGVSLRGGAGDLGVDLGLDQNLSLSADVGLGMDAFSGLKDAAATVSGGVAKLSGGMAQLSGGAGLSLGGGGGGNGGALFTAKAEVGAKVDLGALLFPEEQT